jgi:hypothetical protein
MKLHLLRWTVLLSFAIGSQTTLAAPDFSGTWVLNTARSKNIGMMANMQITLRIEQTTNTLKITELSKYNGREQNRELRYDLTGKNTLNDGPMGDSNQTVTKWSGQTLETIWTADGAVAGSKVVRTETRWLSDGAKTMSDQYVRGSNPPMILVFEKQ